MFAGSLAVFSAIFFSFFFRSPTRAFHVSVCMGVLSVPLHSNELLFNLQSNHKLHNSRFKHSNNQSASERAGERTGISSFRPQPGSARKSPGKPLLKITQNPPGKATPSTTIFVFPSSTYISRHCHLHVQLSAFRSRSFKCSSRCLTLFFCNFSALVLLFLFFCFWFFVLFLENFTIYLFMRWLQFGIL